MDFRENYLTHLGFVFFIYKEREMIRPETECSRTEGGR